VEKYGTAEEATDDNIIRRTACWIPKKRIQTHTHNFFFLLLFHGSNCYANAPQCHVIRKLSLLFRYCYDTLELAAVPILFITTAFRDNVTLLTFFLLVCVR
jgi:hypothetical protein